MGLTRSLSAFAFLSFIVAGSTRFAPIHKHRPNRNQIRDADELVKRQLGLPANAPPAVELPSTIPAVSKPGVELPSVEPPSLGSAISTAAISLSSVESPGAVPTTVTPGVDRPSVELPAAVPTTSIPAIELPSANAADPTLANDVLTYITPSPGASPIAITEESQIVTSYTPQFTLCELPPIAFFPVPSPTVTPTSPYQNYSTSIPPGNGTCTTIFDPTITMVCATTLTALAELFTVTNCADEITFSTEYGYVLITPTATPVALPSPLANATAVPSVTVSNGLLPRQDVPTVVITAGPSIETLTTYYLAPWQQLGEGTAPSDVDLKVCRTFENGTLECVREYQVWETSLVTQTTSYVTSINISTTIHGLSQLVVETFVANITEKVTTFSMSTTIDLEYETEWTTTKSSTRDPSASGASTGPTVYQTFTVQPVSAGDDSNTTSTTTIHRTSTIRQTRTVTVSSSSTPAMASISGPPISAPPRVGALNSISSSVSMPEVVPSNVAPSLVNLPNAPNVGAPEVPSSVAVPESNPANIPAPGGNAPSVAVPVDNPPNLAEPMSIRSSIATPAGSPVSVAIPAVVPPDVAPSAGLPSSVATPQVPSSSVATSVRIPTSVAAPVSIPRSASSSVNWAGMLGIGL